MKSSTVWTIGIAVILILVLGSIVILGFRMNNNAPVTDTDTNPPITTVTNPDTNNNPSTTPTTTPKSYNILVEGYKFSPSTMTIEAGDSITWTNMDSVAHTVTSDSGSELDSPLFGNRKTYSHTFNTPGTYNYYCVPHPSMKGTIIVK